jgi:hypothetical protein
MGALFPISFHYLFRSIFVREQTYRYGRLFKFFESKILTKFIRTNFVAFVGRREDALSGELLARNL